ncbi:MAG TPA: histidinol dehydrogenase [Saprospiraceae bacterium]|nr:histidinol dehydrogenase [Saprospiraceae bacterium]HNT19969.1 histidinol dehydrogenase [Saprospiraceae bacterium]
MKIYLEPPRVQWAEITRRPSGQDLSQESVVQSILDRVRQEGDTALKKYTEKFDQVSLQSFGVSQEEMDQAEKKLDQRLKEAIQIAKSNIEAFHRSQWHEPGIVETMTGVKCWQKTVPIEKVGLYIPGGTAPLFSTVLMLATPAGIAGCREILLCSPPDKFGSVHPAILYSARLCGVTRIFKVGGAQAIAAMAYGTKEIPAVHKIFGPGNSFVTLAKMKVQQEGIAIDLPAGPSEVLVLADESADPSWVASDLLSQAEHGLDSQVVLVADSEDFVRQVGLEMESQLQELPRKKYATGSLAHSHALVLKDRKDQLDFINEYAPEHLILNHRDADAISNEVINAGSVFIGPYSPESVGDYASGTNHTLPTSAYAKAYSGVNLDAFTKKITFQKLDPEGLQAIGPYVELMAQAEQLTAHQRAVSKRLNKLNRP